MNEPTILAMDIGGGTQDILLYDPSDTIENSVKLILPSPTVIAARRIRRVTEAGRPLYISGTVMGGGAASKAVRNHLKAGLPAYSLEDPALTIHDNLDKVRSMGLEIVEDNPDGQAVEVVFGDLDLWSLREALAMFEVELPRTIALCIQDHGYSPNFSNRQTRFNQWQRFLENGGRMDDLLFEEVPEELTRWAAAAQASPGAYFMDTSAAALHGALLDEYAAARLDEGLLVINAGNEHTVAFMVKSRMVFGVYEHHTGLLNPEKLADHLKRFRGMELTHEEIFKEWGHGVAYRKAVDGLPSFENTVITGPRRALALGLGHQAAPYGEMMLSGSFGLIEAVRKRLAG